MASPGVLPHAVGDLSQPGPLQHPPGVPRHQGVEVGGHRRVQLGGPGRAAGVARNHVLQGGEAVHQVDMLGGGVHTAGVHSAECLIKL